MNKRVMLTTVVSVLLTTAPALAWDVYIYADVDDASAVIWGGGGAVEEDPECPDTMDYYLSGSAGIINGEGEMGIYGYGFGGWGDMHTWEEAEGDLVFANQNLVAEVCQEGCEIDLYEASSFVSVEEGAAYISLWEGVSSEWVSQFMYTEGEAGGEFDISMTATRTDSDSPETHTMGMSGENADFLAVGWQGMENEDSEMYGFFYGSIYYGNYGEFCDGDLCE